MKLVAIIFLSLACCCSSLWAEQKPTVLVTVPPHRFFVEQIAGKTVDVELMVPQGSSAHTFEPSPRKLLESAKADLWFQVGEAFEPRALRALKMQNSAITAVDMKRGLDLIYCHEGHICAHHPGGVDLHIWLSPEMAKEQAKTIKEALQQRYPESGGLYEANYHKFVDALNELSTEIRSLLKNSKGRAILVGHPAYGYFVREYDMKQLSVEYDGKDPTAKQLTALLQNARDAGVTKIFLQPQYSNKGALLVAKELALQVVNLDPYSQDYMSTMREIAQQFASP